jgi:glycosyltransferase involved in cell wall biosynthesis
MRIAVIANSAWYLHNFRSALMSELRAAGHEPVAIAPADGYEARLRECGFEYLPLALRPAGTRPWQEVAALWRLRQLLRKGGFELAFTYTPKVNIYTGLARRGLRLRHVPNVSGLGAVFAGRSLLRPLVRSLYATAFRHADTVVFQNDDDRRMFVAQGLVDPLRAQRVPGSGVDLSAFRPVALPARGDAPLFLFIGRVLRDKGILEFVEAARALRRSHPAASFQVLGSTQSDNPAAIPRETVNAWEREGLLTYLGSTDDVRPFIAEADCVVLPSYREGVPRVLLESAAMGRPCITTDAPGCRDAVDDGVTGFVCPPRDATGLLEAMRRFVQAPQSLREQWGRAGRQKMEREFDERLVLRTYLTLAAR